MADTEIQIVEGVNLEDLNRKNFSLKNEYMSNLLSTAFLVLPNVYSAVKRELQVTKGFISGASVRDYPESYRHIMSRYTKGLSLEVTWSPWLNDEAVQAAYNIFNQIKGNPEENVMIVINKDKGRLACHRDGKKTQIVEISGKQKRVLKE
jgi:hypothetical protein